MISRFNYCLFKPPKYLMIREMLDKEHLGVRIKFHGISFGDAVDFQIKFKCDDALELYDVHTFDL